MMGNARLCGIGCLLWLLVGCSPSSSPVADFELQLQTPQQYAESELELSLIRAYNEQAAVVVDLLLHWGVTHSAMLISLTRNQSPQLINDLARQAVASGKSFVLIERLLAEHELQHPLLMALRSEEERDGRMLALDTAVADLNRRLVSLSGRSSKTRWRGAAFIVAESRCQLGLVSAAHNLLDAEGRKRIPLSDFELGYDDESLKLVNVIAPANPYQSSQDWALLVADKPYCNEHYFSEPLAIAGPQALDATGTDVTLLCFYQGKQDTRQRIYQEVCHLNPLADNVLDYYADKEGQPLAIHGCRSDAGSSGCPILLENAGERVLLATQIEGDRQTGAGIARLVQGEFRQAIEQLAGRFAEEDTALVKRD